MKANDIYGRTYFTVQFGELSIRSISLFSSLGLYHDSGSCASRSYIMKSSLPGGEHATEWSECSRNALQRLLKDK